MDNVGKNAIYKGYITKENFIKDFLMFFAGVGFLDALIQKWTIDQKHREFLNKISKSLI